MKRVFIGLLLFSLASGCAVSSAVAKEKARIKNLTLMVDKGSVGISFCVENCFSPKIEKTIQNGVPATFTFFLRLYRSRSVWRDKRLASLKLTRKIHYDNIKKVYQVFLEEAGSPVAFKHFWEAKERLVRVENVKVISRRPLREQATHYVSVKAELEPEGLPFHLENLLFFVSSGSRETDWIVQKFRIDGNVP